MGWIAAGAAKAIRSMSTLREEFEIYPVREESAEKPAATHSHE